MEVFGDLRGIAAAWLDVRSLIRVKRTTACRKQTSSETAYFISSLPPQTSARIFAAGIRGHWRIESFHYTKDVTFREDDWKVRSRNAPANYSLLRNIALNAFRGRGFSNMQAAMEKCANNVSFMRSFF